MIINQPIKLLLDADLTDERLRYERARRYRRMFELGSALLLMLLVLVMAIPAETVVIVYMYMGVLCAWAETIRRGVRQFGLAHHVGESAELAKAVPVAVAAGYVFAWLGATLLLLGTKALVSPWSRLVAVIMTAILLALAVFVTLYGPRTNDTRHVDLAMVVVCISLFLPTQTVTPQTATTLMVMIRLIIFICMQFDLGTRDEGR